MRIYRFASFLIQIMVMLNTKIFKPQNKDINKFTKIVILSVFFLTLALPVFIDTNSSVSGTPQSDYNDGMK